MTGAKFGLINTSRTFSAKSMMEASSARGKYQVEVGRIPILSRKDEFCIGQKIISAKDAGERKNAIDELVEANLHLVIQVARKYANRLVLLEDLIQEGNLGLMHAAKKFDANKGRFTAYAPYWIRVYIERAIMDKWQNIRLPVETVEQINKYMRVANFLFNQLEREASLEEIAEEMGIAVADVERIRSNYEMNVVTADSPCQAVDRKNTDPAADYDRCAAVKELEQAMSTLPPRNRRILECYFGFDDSGCENNYASVAREVGLCRDMVRKIVPNALSKVKHAIIAARSRKIYGTARV